MFKFFSKPKPKPKIEKELTKKLNPIALGISRIFTKKKLDSKILEDLEDLLISCDIGLQVTNDIISYLKKEKFSKELSLEEIKSKLKR